MKFVQPFNAGALAAEFSLELMGDAGAMITGINEIHMVTEGDLTFVDHPKYYQKALHSAASFVLINKKEVEVPPGKTIFVCADPFSVYNAITKKYAPFKASSQTIASDAIIGEGTVIQPGAFVGPGVVIGRDCVIHSNVSIQSGVIIGDRVVVQANSVIGSDAFYYKRRPEFFERMHSCGRVLIHDEVEIGASCTIDKGVSGDTVLGAGTKIDNHVHIGHDTVIGKNVLIAAQCGIAGVSVIEDEVILWGQVGVNKDLVIGKGAIVLGQSGVTKSLAGGKTYFGTPAAEVRQRMKEIAWWKEIPALMEEIKSIRNNS
jgi:UDP-3-O-[3-hydroxymyristoyl] glucosamine N-acyltransferase